MIGHYGRVDPDRDPEAPPITLRPGVTVVHLESGAQDFLLRDLSPLAIAFGNGNQALILSNDLDGIDGNGGFELFDPTTKTFSPLRFAPVDSKGLPVPFATLPPEIIQASAGVSADGQVIYVLAEAAQDQESMSHLIARYDVPAQVLTLVGFISAPDPSPVGGQRGR